MGLHIVKQPKDKWAVWCTVSDTFVALNMTKEDAINLYVESASTRARRNALERIEDIENGDTHYAWEDLWGEGGG